jgi:hypothetical protein
VAVVSPAEMATSEKRNFVRSRAILIGLSCPLEVELAGQPPNPWYGELLALPWLPTG